MAGVVGCSVVSSRTNTVENQLTRTSPSSLKEASLVHGSDRLESSLVLDDEVMTPHNFQHYLERYRDFTENSDGPPRWFTLLECGAPCKSRSKFRPKWWSAKKIQSVKP
ncbi:hypothetical protein AMTRI_Chr03g55160 [Amborella trichopoda]